MANFEQHIEQAKHNLNVLTHLNTTLPTALDWQVTSAYYVAVHLANAVISKFGLHYRSHEKVKHAISPYNQTALPGRFNCDAYVAYIQLENLSRRSRYLCNVETPEENGLRHATKAKHLRKALRTLNEVIKFMVSEHQVEFPPVFLHLDGLKSETLVYFKCVSEEAA